MTCDAVALDDGVDVNVDADADVGVGVDDVVPLLWSLMWNCYLKLLAAAEDVNADE